MNINKKEEIEINKLFRDQKIALYWMLGFIYFAFIEL